MHSQQRSTLAGPVGSFVNKPIVFFDDFMVCGKSQVDAALMSESDPWGWISDLADGGAWLVSYDALVDAAAQLPLIQDDADGGWIACTTDATSGERISMQLNGESFAVALGRVTCFEWKGKVSATTADAFIGLSVATTDPHASAPSDAIAFKLSGDADIEVLARIGSSGSGVDCGVDIVADTMTTLGFRWDGKDTVQFFVNGVLAYTSSYAVTSTLYFSPVICIESNGAALTLTSDYAYVEVERD